MLCKDKNKLAGIAAITAGILLVMFCLPFWVWSLAAGIALVILGILILH